MKIYLGQNTIKGTTHVNEHSLKLHFCIFETQVEIMVCIIINVFGIFSINCKVYMFKVWHKQKMFLHVQSTQTLKMDYPYFFQTSFFSTKCAPFLLKVREDFNIDVYKGKRTWIDEIIFYNQFEHIWFKCAFDITNYGFRKCDLNKKMLMFIW